MSKRIAFCADGTWDSADKHTNVYKLYKALPVSADQMPFYDDGVGADGNPVWKLLGGAFGTGLWQKIKDGLRKSLRCMKPAIRYFCLASAGALTRLAAWLG
jgi:uncharacterized protein (DUF2235 family)